MTLPNPPKYNPNTPAREISVADAQPQFLGNFETLFDYFGRNHVALNDATNPGNHTIIEMLQRNNPQATRLDELGLYSKLVKGQTNEPFLRYPASGNEFQWTDFQIYEIDPTDKQEAYFTSLPGGIIVYFGKVLSNGKKEFSIDINPALSISIMGVNTVCIGGINLGLQPPNVSLLAPAGLVTQVVLSSSRPMSDNYYLIFGNL